MKLVVAGALGHIGSAVIRQIPSKLDIAEIVMIDNMMTQRYCSLFNLPTHVKYRFIEADLLNMDLQSIFHGADVVIQLAAITDAAGSFENKERVEHNNYNTTAKVAEVCSKAGCRMIHLSSTSVYGTQREMVDEDCPPEDLRPQSPYAETKLKEEQFLQQLGLTGKLRFVTFRCGTICGVSQGMRFHTAVNKFCWQAVMGQPITVWRTAMHQKRPYLDLGDAVEAMRFVIERNLFDNRIYNVLTENLTVHSILKTIQKYIPEMDIKYVDSEIMNQLSYNVSDRRFKSMGFIPQGSIDERIKETINLLRGCAGNRCKI
jgi:nucleoside-diphosphate-sugar epimerase